MGYRMNFSLELVVKRLDNHTYIATVGHRRYTLLKVLVFHTNVQCDKLEPVLIEK